MDDYKGKLIDASVAVEYDIWKHVGLGLGVNPVRIDVEIDDDTSIFLRSFPK